MFWGLIMEPQRRYSQQVKKSFHISMAALDVSGSSEEPAQVMCGFGGRNYLLCTLRKPDMLQCPLDLHFDVGSEVSFAANGKCYVHLSGYITDELNTSETEAEEKQEEEEEVSRKSKKRSKDPVKNGPPNKKSKKKAQVTSSQDQDVENESDDSDLDVNALLEKSLPDSDDDDSDALENEEDVEEEEEVDLDEEEDDLEDEEDESSLSESEDETEKVKEVKPKVNGVPAKKEKQKKKEINEKNKITPNKNDKSKKTPETSPKKRVLQGGVIVEDLREGQGAPAKNGRVVNVYYEGRLKQNNKLFDSAKAGKGFNFRLGNSEVIKGWDVGVSGMKIGGKRRITCPPSMAYGPKGAPPEIPPNSTLVFEVELRKVS